MSDLTEPQYWCPKCELYWTEPHCPDCGQVISSPHPSVAPPSVRSIEWVDALREIGIRHQAAREQYAKAGNYTAMSVAAIKEEAIREAMLELRRASTEKAEPRR